MNKNIYNKNKLCYIICVNILCIQTKNKQFHREKWWTCMSPKSEPNLQGSALLSDEFQALINRKNCAKIYIWHAQSALQCAFLYKIFGTRNLHHNVFLYLYLARTICIRMCSFRLNRLTMQDFRRLWRLSRTRRSKKEDLEGGLKRRRP